MLPTPGDPASSPELDATYDKLRAMARRWIAELPPGQTLQPTALVHEAWIRLEGRESQLPPGSRTFLFLMGRAMRDTLVESSRRKGALKRGSHAARVELGEDEAAEERAALELLDVHEALLELEREDPESAQVVLLRYFAGLTVPEIAEGLGCSVSSVERRWGYARAWLRRRMSDPGDGPDR